MALVYLLLGAGIFFWSINYYWPRVIYTAVGLSMWAVFAIGVPVWAVSKYLRENDPMAALLACLLGLLTFVLWLIPLGYALGSYRDLQRRGTFWKPWNHR